MESRQRAVVERTVFLTAVVESRQRAVVERTVFRQGASTERMADLRGWSWREWFFGQRAVVERTVFLTVVVETTVFQAECNH